MRDELRSLQKRLGITSLYVTHDQSEAMAISDNVVLMNMGKIIQIGPSQKICITNLNPYSWPTLLVNPIFWNAG